MRIARPSRITLGAFVLTQSSEFGKLCINLTIELLALSFKFTNLLVDISHRSLLSRLMVDTVIGIRLENFIADRTKLLPDDGI